MRKLLLLLGFFFLTACTSCKNRSSGNENKADREQNAIRHYGPIFFDFGAVDDGFSGHSLAFAVGRNSDAPTESELLIPSKAEREAVEKDRPYAYILNSRQTCNDFIPLYVQVQIKNPAGVVTARLEHTLSRQDCDLLHICVKVEGQPGSASLQIKKAKIAIESDTPLPNSTDTGGTGTKTEGTPDKPATDTDSNPVDSSTPGPAPAEQSVPEAFHVDCRS